MKSVSTLVPRQGLDENIDYKLTPKGVNLAFKFDWQIKFDLHYCCDIINFFFGVKLRTEALSYQK